MFFTVKVLGKIVSILTTLANKADTQRFTAKVNARTKLIKKVEAAHKARLAEAIECGVDEENLEIALTEEIAKLEQSYGLKQQAITQRYQDAVDKEANLTNKHIELDKL